MRIAMYLTGWRRRYVIIPTPGIIVQYKAQLYSNTCQYPLEYSIPSGAFMGAFVARYRCIRTGPTHILTV